MDNQRKSADRIVGSTRPAPLQPPGTDAGDTGINDHNSLAGSPLPIQCTGHRLALRMGMGTAENPPASLARPSLGSDLFTGIECKA